MTEQKPESLKLTNPSEVNKKDDPEQSYPWHLLLRTIVLLNAFLGNHFFIYFILSETFALVLGATEGVIGPTLLDLKDLLGVTVGQISFILMMSSIGSMIGCFTAGYIFDKLKQHQYLIMAGNITKPSCSS